MKSKRLNLLRAAVIAAALICIAVGLFRGEAQLVLRKAMYICLECIGVG